MMSVGIHMFQQLFVNIWQVYKDADACMSWTQESGVNDSFLDGDVAFHCRLLPPPGPHTSAPDRQRAVATAMTVLMCM